MKVTRLPNPLPGEHLNAVHPVMRPDADPGWQDRLNFWTGRALTAEALQQEQESRAGHLAWRGRLTTAGVVSGLGVALEVNKPAAALAKAKHNSLSGCFIHVDAGYGIAATGEDVIVPRPLRLDLDRVPVIYARTDRAAYLSPPVQERMADKGIATARPWFNRLDLGSRAANWHLLNKRYTPWAAVLVLRPVELLDEAARDPFSPCPLDESREAFDDPRRLDAAQFVLCMVPPILQAHPLLKHAQAGPTWRNRIASLVSQLECERTRRLVTYRRQPPRGVTEWSTAMLEGDLLPWEIFGVPLGLVGFEPPPGKVALPPRLFLDRAAVVRPGGRALPRTRTAVQLSTDSLLVPPGAGVPAVWQARVAQFNEHVADLLRDPAYALPPGTADTTLQLRLRSLAAHFDFLPPAGLLPRAALHFLDTATANQLHRPDRADTSWFFPGNFPVCAVPATEEEIPALLAAAAPLAPFDLAKPEPVCLLVPLPERLFDPQLLSIEQPDPLFAAEVDRLVALRQDWRQRRDHVRDRRNQLLDSLVANHPAVPATDPGQLEPEPTEHQPFDHACIPPVGDFADWELTIADAGAKPTQLLFGQRLRVFLALDAEAPPRAVELRWTFDQEDDVVSTWTEMPVIAAVPPINGQPQPVSLWRRFETVLRTFKGPAALRKLTLSIRGGRAAVGPVLLVDRNAKEELIWWQKDLSNFPLTSPQGHWTSAYGFLRAPFESPYSPVLADNNTLDYHSNQIAARLDAAFKADEMTPPAGFEPKVAALEHAAQTAEDVVALAFERTRAILQRVRHALLGEQDSEQTLGSPAIGAISVLKPSALAQGTLVRNLALKTEPATTTERRVRFKAAESVATPKLVSPRLINLAGSFFNDPANEAAESAATCLSEILRDVSRLQIGLDDTAIPDLSETIPDKDDEEPPKVTFAQLRKGGTAFAQKLKYRYATRSINGKPDEKPGEVLAKAIHRADLVMLLLRHVEKLIGLRRDFIAEVRTHLALVQAQIVAANSRLFVIESRLAEVRHDVAVARALWREEIQRVDTINTRRDELLGRVTQLAFVRPRSVDLVRRDLPSIQCDRSDALEPVPAALLAHREPPEELEHYLQLFRHAPVRWFRALAPRLPEINTRDRLTRLLSSVHANAARLLAAPEPVFAADPGASLATYRAAFGVIEPLRRQALALPFVKLDTSWEECRRVAEVHATIGDLVEGAHGISLLARSAAQELENIGKVATALHAEFAAVAPGVRMLWVERYSEFDRPAPLRDIALLPRAEALLRDSRRRFQAYLDWLFSRINLAEPGAISLVSDLVRLCLLLASHAPVDRLILGHVPRPLPIRPGILVPLRPVDPRLVRVGMEFKVWRNDLLVARGRVEDLRDGEVSARVEEHDSATTSLDVNMQVQFQSALTGTAATSFAFATAR